MRLRRSIREFVRRSVADRRQLLVSNGLYSDLLEPRILLAAFQPDPILDPFAENAVSLDQMLERAAHVAFLPGELIVAVELPGSRESGNAAAAPRDWAQFLGVEFAQPIRTLMTVPRNDGRSVSLVHLALDPQADLLPALQQAYDQPDVLWAAPNFAGDAADPRDYIPNDALYASQYHHPLMNNDDAWDLTLGDPAILIGVTDDGVSLSHVDLVANIWVNGGELPGNGLDDDGNGYIDDVNGWDFINNNNNPNPEGSNDHGTHVAGIAAGRTDNGIGIAGTAGRSTILPLQFYNGSWNAAEINAAFTYGTDNGARIISTSYNIDGWVGDPVFTAGMQYMYDHGVLHFNSAGNNNQLNPVRTNFHQSLFVVSTEANDTRSSFSNYGVGVDISAPGGSILSTVLNNNYGTKSGTSMSTPNAAGAAALVWAQNPSWNRDQVAAQLVATADSIDAVNPAYAGLLGSGRVNSFAALTTTLAAPRVQLLNGLPANGTSTSDLTIDDFEIGFTQIMDPASVNNLANFDLRSAGVDGVFGTGDDGLVALSSATPYMIGTNRLTFNFSNGPLGYGSYRLTVVSGGLQNPFGTDLDGNGNGTGGDAYVISFDIAPPAPVAVLPLGSLVYEQSYFGSLASAGSSDQLNLSFDAGQMLKLVVAGQGALVPTIQVRDPNGVLIASVAGSGSVVQTAGLPLNLGGAYAITVSGAGGTVGSYTMRLLLNAGVEQEGAGGPGNNTLATAESLAGSSASLGTGGADRLAVVGQTPTSDGVPIFTQNFESGSLGAGWTTFSSSAQGRIQITGQHGTASGNFAMLMDVAVDNTNNLNQAIWTVNLTGLTNPRLNFYHAEWADEETALPASFNGNVNGDGVAISANGTNWFRVFTPTSIATGVWQKVTVDLAAAAAAAGISLGANFQIKFQQYDNFSLTTDGRGYDEISITVPSTEPDWYSFTLDDGQTATIAATKYAGNGSTQMGLYDAGGALLQNGAAGTNLSSFVSQFVDSTSNGVPDTYYVRVSGLDAFYSLLVTRGADFDTEPNDQVNNQYQDITGLGGVLGHLGNNDVYGIMAVAGQELNFVATLPGQGPHWFVNGLDAPGGSNLRLELINPSGSVVATNASSISHIAALSGLYQVRVYSTSGSGEYILEMPAPATGTIEAGVVQNVTDVWQTVTLAQSFADPIVIVGPLQTGDLAPATARIRNVTSNSFEIQVNEWDYLDGPHGAETVSYLVLNRGVTTLDNGKVLVAGSVAVGDAWSGVAFGSPFAGVPVVLATLASENGVEAVTTRLSNVGGAGFSVRIQGEEINDGSHSAETVNYLATMPGIGVSNGLQYDVGLVPQVTHKAFPSRFQQTFLATPGILASMQTFNASDPANVRLKALTAKRMTPFIEEEQSLDTERSHAGESVGYLAFRFASGGRSEAGNGQGTFDEAPTAGSMGVDVADAIHRAQAGESVGALPGAETSRPLRTIGAPDTSIAITDAVSVGRTNSEVPARAADPIESDGTPWRTQVATKRVGFQWYWDSAR